MLPPHLGKRKLYAKWCWDRGWIPEQTCRARSKYAPIAQFKIRPASPSWPPGTDSKEICAWPTFLQYWKENHSHIK
eukprot:6356994-Ditylum_brightwellii.AAC.1